MTTHRLINPTMMMSSAALLALAAIGCAGELFAGSESEIPATPYSSTIAVTGDELAGYFTERFGLTLDNVYWGEFHTHSLYSADGSDDRLTPAAAYEYARDDQDLDFFGLGDHAELANVKAVPEEDASLWESQQRIARAYNEEDPDAGKVFVVFAGWEYTNGFTGTSNDPLRSEVGYGHKNVIFRELERLPSRRIGAYNLSGPRNDLVIAEDAASLWNRLFNYRPACAGCVGDALTIIHTPASIHEVDWDVMNPSFVRNVEIYSAWGSSEGSPPQPPTCWRPDPPLNHADLPEENSHKALRPTLYERFVQQGDTNFALSFLGGSDNHRGEAATPYKPRTEPQDQPPNAAALTGILAPSLTRDALWSGLWARHTLAASSGSRMSLLFAVETAGQHLLSGDLGRHDGQIRVRVQGSVDVQQLDLIIDGCLVQTHEGNLLDVTRRLSRGRHYIYVRAAKVDTDEVRYQSWTSPVYLTGN